MVRRLVSLLTVLLLLSAPCWAIDARQQNSAAHPFMFLMVSSVDHVTPVLGLAPTVTVSKDGGAFGAPIGVVSEVGSGWYKVAGNAADTNTLGILVVHATAAGADPSD